MSRSSAILDACVLVPIRLATTLLWLAEAGMFDVLWSDAILGEVERNLPNVGVSAESAARRVGMMREAFGAAALVSEFEHLIPSMTCDVKDRHVLAAAVRGGADTLVTFNLRDFPRESTAPHDINVIDPDLFLLRLLAEHDTDVIATLERESAALHKPTQTMRQFLASLTVTVPTFANLAADAALSAQSHPPPASEPEVGDEDDAAASFGEPGDWTNPAQVALGWWTGVRHNLDQARALTLSPSTWGNYQRAADELAGKSLISQLIPAIDAPERIVFMRFVPEDASSAEVFLPYLEQTVFVTLIRRSDGEWRVWRLGRRLEAAKDVQA